MKLLLFGLVLLLPYQGFCEKPIFVSLGSTCDVAHALRACDLRDEAYPFDWICSFLGHKLIQILEDDFLYFLDKRFLILGAKGPGFLLNDIYHLEFLHEGDFRGEGYGPNMEKLQEKYQRRIERFRALKDYPGTVVFIRSCYRYSNTDPHRQYYCDENLEISDELSLKLLATLEKYFDGLNFILIVINESKTGQFEEVKLAPNLIQLEVNFDQDVLERFLLYGNYLTSLYTSEFKNLHLDHLKALAVKRS